MVRTCSSLHHMCLALLEIRSFSRIAEFTVRPPLGSPWPHDIIKSLWCQNDVATSFWRHNDVFASCADWAAFFSPVFFQVSVAIIHFKYGFAEQMTEFSMDEIWWHFDSKSKSKFCFTVSRSLQITYEQIYNKNSVFPWLRTNTSSS